jgi:hypothetical protein
MRIVYIDACLCHRGRNWHNWHAPLVFNFILDVIQRHTNEKKIIWVKDCSKGGTFHVKSYT